MRWSFRRGLRRAACRISGRRRGTTSRSGRPGRRNPRDTRTEAKSLQAQSVQLTRGIEAVGRLELLHGSHRARVPLTVWFALVVAVACQSRLNLGNALRCGSFLSEFASCAPLLPRYGLLRGSSRTGGGRGRIVRRLGSGCGKARGRLQEEKSQCDRQRQFCKRAHFSQDEPASLGAKCPLQANGSLQYRRFDPALKQQRNRRRQSGRRLNHTYAAAGLAAQWAKSLRGHGARQEQGQRTITVGATRHAEQNILSGPKL